MTADGGPEPAAGYHQTVRAVGGFAYGVIGASLHVFGDGVPVYLLLKWQAAPAAGFPEAGWLRRVPSYMLNARFAVVPFTGRADALGGLRRWRDADGSRLAVRWLHAEGGAGKTRLAAKLAAESAELGWLVVTAVRGPGTVLPPPGSQDLTGADAAGLLLLVDYADGWPETDLAWLLSNELVHRPGFRVRILMLARTISGLSHLRAVLANQQADITDQHLVGLRRPGHAADGSRQVPGRRLTWRSRAEA